jgi:hypothetical protein
MSATFRPGDEESARDSDGKRAFPIRLRRQRVSTKADRRPHVRERAMQIHLKTRAHGEADRRARVGIGDCTDIAGTTGGAWCGRTGGGSGRGRAGRSGARRGAAGNGTGEQGGRRQEGAHAGRARHTDETNLTRPPFRRLTLVLRGWPGGASQAKIGGARAKVGRNPDPVRGRVGIASAA